MINTFKNIYEPSGIIQLSNGEILIVEDDGSKPLSLLKLNDKKPHKHLKRVKGFKFPSIVINDLEAITCDQQDHIYVITSHSLNAKGKYNKNRNRFIHFTLKQQQLGSIKVIKNFREWILSSYPKLKKSAKLKKVQKQGGLNIEGLAYDKKQQQLLVGLRSPLNKHNKAIIIPVDLNKQTFKNKSFNDKPHKLITLDLDGAGIRDFTFVKHLNAFLILSGTSSSTHKKTAKLWIWKHGKKAVEVKIKATKKLGTAEGITAVKLINKEEGIMIVIDDGEVKNNKFGHYLFISYDKLKIEEYN